MLLRMRSLPPKTTVRPDNGTLKAVDGSDENAMRWFDMIQVSRMYFVCSSNQTLSFFLLTLTALQHTTSKNVRTQCSILLTRAHSTSVTAPGYCSQPTLENFGEVARRSQG